MRRFHYILPLGFLACSSTGIDAAGTSSSTLEELTASGERGKRGFETRDTNGDGALSEDEVGAEKWAELSKADADASGSVTKEEIEAAIAAGTLKPPRKGHGDRGPRLTPEERFAKDDTNGDGALTADEISADHWTRLSAADADASGGVTLEEIKAAIDNGTLQPPKGPPPFTSIDTNGDGSIDASEAGDKWEHLAKADADGNGLVTEAELQAARPPEGGRGHGGGPGRH